MARINGGGPVQRIAAELDLLQRQPSASSSMPSSMRHDQLLELGDDDHTQYALANGTRGNFEAAGAVTAHLAAKEHWDYRGAFAFSTAYAVRDVVTYDGRWWLCVTAYTSGSEFDESKWVKLGGDPWVPIAVPNLQLIGHSYVDNRGVGVPGTQGFGQRMAAALGLPEERVNNIAVSGGAVRQNLASCSYVTALQECNPGKQSWPYIPQYALIASMFGTNDAIMGDAEGDWVENSFKAGYATLIARYLAGWVMESDDVEIVQSAGTWTEVTWDDVQVCGSGTGYLKSTVVDDELTFTLPANYEGTKIDVGFIGGYRGGTASITVDGTLHGSVTTSGLSVYADQRCGVIYTIDGLTAGVAHTIKVKTTSLTTDGEIRFDYVSIRANPYPMFLVVGMPQPSNPQWIWSGIDQACTDKYNEWMQDVIFTGTQFNDTAIRFVDTDSVMGADPKYFSTDGLHWNARGAALAVRQCMLEVERGIANGVDFEQVTYAWAGEHPITADDLFELHTVDGPPVTVYDDFTRDDALTLGADWTAQSGSWGVMDGAAYCYSHIWALPTWTDLFNRADSETTLGSPWTVAPGDGVWGIASNQAKRVSGSTGDNQFAIVDTGDTDMAVRFKIGHRVNYMGIVVRYVDVDNWLAVWTNATFGGFGVTKRVAGVQTNVASFTDIFSNDGLDMHVEVNGDLVTFHQSGGYTSATTYTIEDAALRTGTKCGLFIPTSGNLAARWDEFNYGPVVAHPDAPFSLATFDVGIADAVVGWKVGRRNNFVGFAVRVQDYQNFVFVYPSITYGNWIIRSVIDGEWATPWVTIVGPNASGTRVTVKMTGDQYEFYFNGVASTSNPVTNADFETETLAGMCTSGVGDAGIGDYNTWDDVTAGGSMVESAVVNDWAVDTSGTSSVGWYGPYDGGSSWPLAFRLALASHVHSGAVWRSVADYGPIYGDDSAEHGTANAAAFAAAIADMPQSGGHLVIPEGTYVVDDTWTVHQKHLFWILGQGSVTIKFNPPTEKLTYGLDNDGCYHGTFDNIEFTAIGYGVETMVAVDWSDHPPATPEPGWRSTSGVLYRRVNITGNFDTGFWVGTDRTGTYQADNIFFDKCVVSGLWTWDGDGPLDAEETRWQHSYRIGDGAATEFGNVLMTRLFQSGFNNTKYGVWAHGTDFMMEGGGGDAETCFMFTKPVDPLVVRGCRFEDFRVCFEAGSVANSIGGLTSSIVAFSFEDVMASTVDVDFTTGRWFDWRSAGTIFVKNVVLNYTATGGHHEPEFRCSPLYGGGAPWVQSLHLDGLSQDAPVSTGLVVGADTVVTGTYIEHAVGDPAVVTTFVPAEPVQDIVGAMVTDAGLLTATYDDGAGTLALDVPTEAVQDVVGAMAADAGLAIVTYDDGAGTLTTDVPVNDVKDALLPGVIYTARPSLWTTQTHVMAANNAHFLRVEGGIESCGTIRFGLLTPSGNVSFGICKASTAGGAPDSRAATTGDIACPGSGVGSVTFTGVRADASDSFLCLSADNTTVVFRSAGGLPGTLPCDLGIGIDYYQTSAHPIPASPSPSPAWNVTYILTGTT